MKVYKHLNPGKVDAYPSQSTRSRIGSPRDVRDWLVRTGQGLGLDVVVTTTFIIDIDGWLWIADRHSEHVACAAGRDVLSAGEMTFDVSSHAVRVTDATNQSLGYCPEPDSWPAIASALERAGIAPLGGFTAEFIFRKCLECDTKNIVKDGWYTCDVCGASLSQDWNFAGSGSTSA